MWIWYCAKPTDIQTHRHYKHRWSGKKSGCKAKTHRHNIYSYTYHDNGCNENWLTLQQIQELMQSLFTFGNESSGVRPFLATMHMNVFCLYMCFCKYHLYWIPVSTSLFDIFIYWLYWYILYSCVVAWWAMTSSWFTHLSHVTSFTNTRTHLKPLIL